MGLSQLLRERMRPKCGASEEIRNKLHKCSHKKWSYETTHDLKHHLASVVQRYVIDLAICLTFWCIRCATKASVVR